MLQLPKTVTAWGTSDFEDVFRAEVKGLGAERLPLQQGLSAGSYALGARLDVMLIGASEEGALLRVRAGVFFSSILAGCSCADDPTPADEYSEYCELQFDIDRETAGATVSLR